MDLSLRLLADSKQAKEALGDFQTAALAAGKVLKDLAVESVKVFAESERNQRQLRLAAGKYTEALNEQAEALKRKFAVDDDEIRHMDVLLLRYGAAPAAIEGATEAVLNYAAATGKDATQAMEMLIRGVESGTGSLGKMGVHFKSTGQFSEDLAAAIEALNKKFGGAGEEDAKSLDGRLRSVTLATDDLKKTFGAMFDELDRRTGLLDKLAAGLNKVNAELQEEGLAVVLGLKQSRFHSKEQLEMTGGMGGLFDENDPKWKEMVASAQTRDHMADVRAKQLVGFLMSKGAIPSNAGQVDPTLPSEADRGQDHAVGTKSAGTFHKSALQLDADFHRERQNMAIAAADKIEKAEEESLHDRLERMEHFYQEQDRLAETKVEEEERALSDRLERMEKYYQEEDRLADQHQAEMDQKFKQQAEQWRRAGDAMGAALVNSIGEQLLRLAEGGDTDPAEMAGDVVATILGIAGFAIGTYFGAPQIGGAIGGLAGGLAKAGIKAGFGKKKHDGGVIERYHDGGWPGLAADEVPIIAQQGEHMLSRRDVANMGGQRGVESAKRGGAMQVTIHAIDSYSFQEQMGGDGRAGRGIFNAIRVGRGDLVPLFGGG